MNPSPHRVRIACPERPVFRAGLAVGLAAATAAGLLAASPSATAELAHLAPTGSLVVTLRGNGHGHGMSQYGAQGAAVRGLNYLQILGFYYPGTSAAPIAPSTIRVKLSSPGPTLTVAAGTYLSATGVAGPLPFAGISRYRFVRLARGTALQQLPAAAGSRWRTLRDGLGSGAAFARPGALATRVYAPNGKSTAYHGVLKLVRTAASAYVVNRVSLDDYTAGVVGREMPVSWRAQAVNAQAVAARSYGRYAVEEKRKNYDICDTTQCQVYGGAAQYSRTGGRLTTDYQRAARATANRVLRYQGRTIFAQFSASNGGWISDGGKPYLKAKRDPYDASAPGNPYLNYQRKVSVRSLASQFGFTALTAIAVVRRDGVGTWGGRAQQVALAGTGAGGKPKRVAISGLDLQWAIGAGTTLFTVRSG